MEIKGECPLSIQLKQKRHVKSSHCFFQVKGKLIFLFQYKQKFTHWFWKYKPRKDNFTSAGASLAVLSLFKNLWTYASCCPLTFFFFFFHRISLALLCLPHWARTMPAFLLTDPDLFCDNHRITASEGNSQRVVCPASRWASWS